MVLITGAGKSIALYKAVEEGVCHMWTVSAFQQHNNTLMVCDEDATLELRVRTVKYFKVSVMVHNSAKIYKIIDLFWRKVVSEKIQPLIFARDLSFYECYASIYVLFTHYYMLGHVECSYALIYVIFTHYYMLGHVECSRKSQRGDL